MTIVLDGGDRRCVQLLIELRRLTLTVPAGTVIHLIATDPEEIDGHFTGEVAGTPCFREGKVVRLEQFLEARGTRLDCLSTSWFYSDSLNDLPLLEKVRHPVAVDPDSTLRAHAEARNWPVISLRSPSPQGHTHP